jgi:hypothetical protein
VAHREAPGEASLVQIAFPGHTRGGTTSGALKKPGSVQRDPRRNRSVRAVGLHLASRRNETAGSYDALVASLNCGSAFAAGRRPELLASSAEVSSATDHELLAQPGGHHLDLRALGVPDGRGEWPDGGMHGEVSHDQLLRHHDGHHVVRDHVFENASGEDSGARWAAARRAVGPEGDGLWIAHECGHTSGRPAMHRRTLSLVVTILFTSLTAISAEMNRRAARTRSLRVGNLHWPLAKSRNLISGEVP